MAFANALLVRYAHGYHLVEDAASIAARGRHEAFLTLGAVQSTEEVERVGFAVLALAAAPTVATTAGIEPTGAGDEPFVDFAVGDYVTAPDETGAGALQRVRGLTVAEDAEGNPIFAPELGSLADELDARLQRWLRRMANGTIGGTVESASPATSSPSIGSTGAGAASKEFPPFSGAGAVVVTVSGRYKPPFPGRTSYLRGTVETAGSTSTTWELRKNGVAVGTVTIPAGAHEAVAALSVTFAVGDYFNAAITSAGTGAAAPTLQVGYL